MGLIEGTSTPTILRTVTSASTIGGVFAAIPSSRSGPSLRYAS